MKRPAWRRIQFIQAPAVAPGGPRMDVLSRDEDAIRRIGLAILVWGAAAVSLLWAPLVNGGVIFFYDSAGYLRSAVQAFHVAGIESDWSAVYHHPGSAQPVTPGTEGEAAGPQSDGFISAARSIYYGVLLYGSELLGGLWLAVAIQALAAALAIALSLRNLLGLPLRQVPPILCLLGLLTPLSLYIGYLMPDIFAGIAILACAALLVLFERLDRRTRALWFALLTAALLFHASFIPLAVLLLACGMPLVRILTKSLPWKPAALIFAAVAIGLLAQAAFFRTVEAVYGHPPLHPPFLMARVIADGPGYDFLRETCPASGFAVCEFLPVLPLDTDAFLWSQDPQAGVMGPADPETRAALVREQAAFVAAVLRHDFGGQAAAALEGFAEQLARFDVGEFRYTDSLRKMLLDNLPPGHHAHVTQSLLYRDGFPLENAGGLFIAVLTTSVLGLTWGARRLSRSGQWSAERRGASLPPARTVMTFCIVVLCGVMANAAVTGILSSPHDRYQARVIWLVTFLAIAVILYLRKLRAAPPVRMRIDDK